jgi:hypothetical protein
MDYLKQAKEMWRRSAQSVPCSPEEMSHLREAVYSLIKHLESVAPEVQPQELTMAHLQEAMAAANRRLVRLESAPEVQPHRHQLLNGVLSGPAIPESKLGQPIPEPREETPQSETPSSVATEMAEETKPTWHTSSRLLFPASQDGGPTPSVLGDIVGWFNSQQIPGVRLGTATGRILMYRDSIPPDGSRSPSTEAQVPAVSGHAGNSCPTHDGQICGACEEMWMGKGRCKAHHSESRQAGQ